MARLVRLVALLVAVAATAASPGSGSAAAEGESLVQPEPLGFRLISSPNGAVSLSWPQGWLNPATEVPIRLTATGATPVPLSSATSATDALPAEVQVACYQVASWTGFGPVLRGNLLCAAPRVLSAGDYLGIEFDETCSGPVGEGRCPVGWGTAIHTWGRAPVPSPLAVLLVPLGTDRAQLLPAGGPRTATDRTGGAFTCYVLLSLWAPTGADLRVSGNSGVVCGRPPPP